MFHLVPGTSDVILVVNVSEIQVEVEDVLSGQGEELSVPVEHVDMGDSAGQLASSIFLLHGTAAELVLMVLHRGHDDQL